jgi:glycerate kinase
LCEGLGVVTVKIVVAPDSFKGSLDAELLCASIRDGIVRVMPNAEIIQVPLADGGEGTVNNLVYSTKGIIHSTEATDPLGHKIIASYGVLGNGETVVIETAAASGLALLPKGSLDPLHASSRGTGELIAAALSAGYRKFIIGLGGSATNDGGTGLLRALGYEFYDALDQVLPEGGAALRDLHRIDESHADPRLKAASFVAATDVTNPLYGPNGASVVFGPQKGATSEMVQTLDEALKQWAAVIYRQKLIDVNQIPGSGAAGGIGAALSIFMNAALSPGIELVMQAANFRQHVKDADLVITGEGRLDRQTLSGKVISGVCAAAGEYKVPVVAICGARLLSGEELTELGVKAAFSIVPGPATLETSIQMTSQWVADQIEQIIRLLA